MRKFFTLFAATLLATSLFASTERNPATGATTDQDLVGTSYTIPALQVAGGGSKIVGEMWDKGVKVRTNKKHDNISNALPFLVNEGKQINGIKIVGISNAEAALTFTSVIIDGTTQSLSGSLPDKNSTSSGTVEINNITAFESVVFITSGANQALICYEITYDDAVPSTEPELSASPDSIAFALTAAHPADSVVVTFTGKNLVAGDYALTVPDLIGLDITPVSVTVGADGKLNADVKVKYAVDVDVAAANTSFSLTIGELTQTVQISYSAVQAKEYMSSLNIEQLVLDYGKGYDIEAALTAAHIDYADINALDSLNDEKAARNEPYLGLKLKTAGASIGGWIHAGDTITIKFGFVGCDIKVRVNGEEMTFPKDDMTNTTLGRRAAGEEYLEIVTTSEKTVVLKQIMINEDIKEVVLPESPQGIDDINAAAPAVKRLINGILVIEKNGKIYNAQGTEIK